ncbi:hypothetical protein J2794_003580 [Paraburkholderia terricola]|uniref:hypothetical protein n=1 Tax=Paraburkholderia terricola TaxID=169427 RepID=UPI002858C461|nr:hypothetical protein [Paraburkholderia terricola]MDR6447464.1 hypothetical protein [Paraburkholderia terricola]
MTPAKYQSALNSQSAIAKKVLEMVPIQDAWSRSEIASHLRRVTKSSPDVAVLDGCLVRLKDAGLIRERQTGFYQRVEIREREVLHVATETKTELNGDAGAPAKSPIDILSGLAERARSLATSVVVLASDIETAALTIEQGNAESNANLDKLRQLQALLKSLA